MTLGQRSPAVKQFLTDPSLGSFFTALFQDNRISLVDYVVTYYLHNVDKVQQPWLYFCSTLTDKDCENQSLID